MLKYPDFWQKRSAVSWALFPFSLVFWAISKLRNLIVKPVFLHSRVVCVGNATVGGAGKTQLVIWLVKKLQSQGHRVLVVSKGYRGKYRRPMLAKDYMDAMFIGDEAKELSAFCPVVVTRKPNQCGHLIKKENPDIVIVDDGLQNPGFIKNCSILVVDGARGVGNGLLLPAGPLRQTLRSVEADVSVVVDNNTEGDVAAWPSMPLFYALITPKIKYDRKQRYYAFAGIGNTERFFQSIQNAGLELVDKRSFPDHHWYSAKELAVLSGFAEKLGATLITTRKDAAKLPRGFKALIFDVCLKIKQERELIQMINEKIF